MSERCTASGVAPTNPDDAPTPSNIILPDGQKIDHWVMCPTEIIKAGFKRPVRLKYQHVGTPGPKYPLADLTAEQKARFGDDCNFVKYEEYPKGSGAIGKSWTQLGKYWTQTDLDKIGKGCGTITSMPLSIANTYAANPDYYGNTFCCGCNKYLPVGAHGEFVWDGTLDRVGT